MVVKKFPYEYRGSSYFGKVYRPIAEVMFESPKSPKTTTIWLVVDTGADFTILPKYVSEDLGISLNKDCFKDHTEGVGGRQDIFFYRKEINIRLGQFVRKVPLAFFDNNELPGLLGRISFLETFDVEFTRSREVIFRE